MFSVVTTSNALLPDPHMKSTQLLLDFGKTVMHHLRLLPEVKSKPAPKRRTALEPDPVLERLCRGLLRVAGCGGLKVSVVWNSRLRTTAGLACWTEKRIALNPRLRAISPREVQRTLRHELAHFVAQHRAGRRRIDAHGPEWRQACRDLGIPREPRCHDIPFPRTRVQRKFFYQCRNCSRPLARVRPPKRPVACIACCRKHNGGEYHERFRFVAVPAPGRAAA